MKIFYHSIFLLFLSLFLNQLNAQHFSDKTMAYDHLSEVNKQWIKHQSASPDITTSFNSDNDRIQFHLKSVIQYLNQNAHATITEAIMVRRTILLKALVEYADKKVFPINKYHDERHPYFIDHLGTHCAVGFLMAESDNDELAQRISREHNYDYVKDIKTEGVLDWAMINGFSLEELAWIQPAYAPRDYMRNVLKGTNGPIYQTQYDGFNKRLIFAGQFDKVNDKPCLNLGYFKEDRLGCFGDGIRGSIQEINITRDAVFVVGQLEGNGRTYPIAFYENNYWTYLEIPKRPNASVSAFWMNGYNKEIIEVVINSPTNANQQELWVWSKKTDKWTKK